MTTSRTAIDRYTTGDYLGSYPSWHVEDSAWKADRIAELLRRNNLRPGSVCDVGCGVGEVLARLHDELSEPASLVGYELSPVAFEACLERRSEHLDFRLADAATARGRFELMLLVDVIEHVEDYLGFLRSHRWKADQTVLHIPLDLSMLSLARPRRLVQIRTVTGHLHSFTKELALAAVADAGYDIVDYMYTRGSIELPTRAAKVRLARYPRRMLAAINEDVAARLLGGFSLLVLAKNGPA